MDASGDNIPKCFWKPNESIKTNFDSLKEIINRKYGINLVSYDEVYTWSIQNYPQFWEEFWHYSGIRASHPFQQVVDARKNIAENPEWFPGSRLNFAENLLKWEDNNKVAIFAASEIRAEVEERTFGQLKQRVAEFAAAMRKMGITRGDRVAAYIPNCPEAIEAMLATSSIGAIWSSTSPEFGVSGVLDRFTQIRPKLLISVNAVVYNGKTHNHMEKLEAVVQGLQDLEKVVIIPYVNDATPDCHNISNIKNACDLHQFLRSADTTPLTYEQLPFSHPLYIMYSSGTTGAPKCIVHSAGGTLIKHLEEHVIQGNMMSTDIIMYYTTTGWMMWNWAVSALAVGASVVCYDGSPLVPTASVLWDLVDNIGVTILGTGAKWLSVLEEKNVKPRESHSLQSLKSILSTGSPLKPQSYEYVYRDIKSDIVLGSITGGTDIIGCFAGNSWSVPVYKGELQCRLLGMAMEAYNEAGEPVLGESGELVCTKPFPSMPVCFWNDSDGEKYKRAYFMKYPDVWAHGDFCQVDPSTGGIVMLGRSDGTLNPNGVRFGSAEIYHVTEAFTEVTDSLCVAQRSHDAMEERVILFLKMAQGCEFSEDIVKRVRTAIRTQLSARHLPAVVLPTADIPYTNSGKKVEIAVKNIIAGKEVKSRGAYANPDSLDLYANIPELSSF